VRLPRRSKASPEPVKPELGHESWAEPGLDNESARTSVWLTYTLGLADGTGLVSERWRQVRSRMRPEETPVVLMQDWVSDPWLARGVRPTPVTTVAPAWDPPERLDEWPGFDADRLVNLLEAPARKGRKQGVLIGTPPSPHAVAADTDTAVASYIEMRSKDDTHAAVRIQGLHTLAWLDTSVGRLLRGIMFSRGIDPEVLTREVTRRLEMPFSMELPNMWVMVNLLEQKRVELLYDLTMDANGTLVWLEPANIRVGQDELWGDNWRSLSAEIGFTELREAVQLTARIMRCAPVVEGLMRALRSERRELQTVALAVVRRWLLTLKTMSWLEESALETWDHVRPPDLACFAFSALKPEWPRRIMAVSHRSRDVKDILSTMRIWRSSRCAVDASYVPGWETNTGMVWGLFGATPVIVRVRSASYEDSVWCLREAELAQHLVDRRDFATSRWVLDIDVSRVRVLDRAYEQWDSPDELAPTQPSGIFREFPPLCYVWMPRPMPPWHVAMWRASAALRAINAVLQDVELTNQLVEDLVFSNRNPPHPPPTSNPGGWGDYTVLFRGLQDQLGDTGQELAIRLPSSYSDTDMQTDAELLGRMPDLSTGTPAIGDAFVALEFMRTEWVVDVEQRRGRFLLVDCRGLSRDSLQEDERLSLHRGLLAVRFPVPLWIIQSAGQRIEDWGLPHDRPIFTEHFEDQFSWMVEIFVDWREAQSRFPEESGLVLSPPTERLCREGQ
jgi:hypothetical protein